jgi:hypothetical protein
MLRSVRELQPNDIVKLKHQRYPSALFTVKAFPLVTTWNGYPAVKIDLVCMDAHSWGPTEYFRLHDMVEIVLE